MFRILDCRLSAPARGISLPELLLKVLVPTELELVQSPVSLCLRCSLGRRPKATWNRCRCTPAIAAEKCGTSQPGRLRVTLSACLVMCSCSGSYMTTGSWYSWARVLHAHRETACWQTLRRQHYWRLSQVARRRFAEPSNSGANPEAASSTSVRAQ